MIHALFYRSERLGEPSTTSKGDITTLTQRFAYQGILYGGNPDRPLILTTFQLKAWIPLDAQSPEAVIASLPGMVKFWLEEQHPGGRFPLEAIRGEAPFPDTAPGLVCDVLSLPETNSWSFRLLHPDAAVGGRTWNTELAYRQTPDRILFGARVSCSILTNRHIPVVYTVPGVVRYALNRIGMRDCVPITCREKTVTLVQDLLDLKGLLANPARTLPVVVLSEVNRNERRPGVLEEYALDAEQLADDLLGLAHVVKLPWLAAFEWTKAVDKEWSVYNGAVRTYYPGLNFAKDDPWDHPNVTAGKICLGRAMRTGANGISGTSSATRSGSIQAASRWTGVICCSSTTLGLQKPTSTTTASTSRPLTT